MKILVTGACGYKGSILVPKLLARGDIIIALDSMWFGNYLKPHPNLSVIKGDVREAKSVPLDGIDAIIHLASVANDPCGDLDPKLTWEVSALATMTLADRAARKGIKRFIYASSGSVYGVKEEERVTEDLELEPISEYNKTKMVAERILLSYANEMIVQIVRPATVCGWSPRRSGGPDQGLRGHRSSIRCSSGQSMRVLGISAFYHDSAAALVEDGRIVAAVVAPGWYSTS
jgi:nucleoside-diphosphate-sugar epimerase